MTTISNGEMIWVNRIGALRTQFANTADATEQAAIQNEIAWSERRLLEVAARTKVAA